jgi:PAS domain S-box-containing protein
MIKFNILGKIRLVFAMMFSITLLITIYLFTQLNTVSEQTRLLYEHPFKVSNTIREIKSEIYLNQNHVRNIRFVDNDRQLDSIKAEIDKRDKVIWEGFKIVSLQYLGNKASVDSAFASYTTWKNTCYKVYQLKKDNKTDSIQILIKHSVIVKFDSLVYCLNIISDFAANKAENTLNEVIKTGNNSMQKSIILVFISGILIIFFIWYLSQSIILPIKIFVSEANILLKKEAGAKVIVNEQILVTTLDELKNAYLNIESQRREIELKNNQLAGINNELEDKVKQRTSELNMANTELAISEMRYRRLFESAKDGILILDAETGMIVDVNPFMIEMLGYSHNEYLGKSLWDVGHFKDVVANKDNFLELQRKQYIRYENLPLETSGGQIVHVEFVSNVYMVNKQKVIQCNIRDISERYRIDETLQKWNSQFKKLSSNAPGMMYQFTRRSDGSYYVPLATEGIREIYGCSPEDVIDDFSPIAKVIYPDDAEKMMAEIEYSAKNLTLFNFEYRVQLPGESIKWLLSKSTPDKMEDGSITWYGYNTDITDRKQAEDTLLKLTEQLEHIGEMAKIGGWELDIATTQVTYSRETARIHEVDFPYVPPKLSQGNEYYPPDVWPDVQAAVQAAIENGTAYDREWPFITAKGKHIWVRAQGFAVRENGKTIQLRGTFQDITERKQAEAELLKSEYRYSSLFNHMQEGFALHEIICDTNGKPVDYRFLDINPSFELLTGLKKSEIIGKTVLTVIPDTETFWIEKYGAVALNGNPMEFENYSVPLKRHYQIKAFCPAKNQFAVLFSNITDRKRAEEVLFNTVQNLERSNKDLEQFAYVANHDLQEPLRMISSYTQLLERKYKDKLDQDALDYIHFAVNGAIRMQKLLNDLLEFSKINSHAKMNEQVGTSTLLGQAVSNLQQLINENTALITNDDLPVINCDEAQIMRVFQNLIENAIKFKKKTELPKIHISCTRQKNMYQFSVADNGIGMEMQYHDRVFIVFQRLHSVRNYPGTGIGLSICKRIVERHGGTIWFESTVNEGTTFYFTIPV